MTTRELVILVILLTGVLAGACLRHWRKGTIPAHEEATAGTIR